MNHVARAGIALALVLAACGKEAPPAPAAPASAPPAAARPADPKLAKLYEQTCRACHSNPGTGAPQAGDATAWESRVAQGMPVLMQHTVGGFKGMPPLGACQDCSAAEFEALIRFMAGMPAP